MPLIAIAQGTLNLRTGTNALSFQAGYGDKIVLSVGQLIYKDEDGDTVPTADSYIIEVINGHYPVIVDGIDGCCLSFKLANIDETNGQDLLAFYHAGGNAYHVKIYKIDGVDIVPLKTQPGASNMGYVKIQNKRITVENQEFSDNPASSLIYLYTDVYRVVGDECQLIKEDKQILSNDANSGKN